VALEQHLGNASGATEVSINLEWRVSIEHVGIGATALLLCTEDEESVDSERQLVLDEFVGMFTIKQTCPAAYLPTHAPTSADIASSFERCTGGTPQLRRAEG
jgi:hypothetical protein